MAKFKGDAERLLEAISNSGSTFSEFCRDYSDTPERGDREAWAVLFDKLEMCEKLGLVQVERSDNRRIESLTLTEQGAARLRELQAKAF